MDIFRIIYNYVHIFTYIKKFKTLRHPILLFSESSSKFWTNIWIGTVFSEHSDNIFGVRQSSTFTAKSISFPGVEACVCWNQFRYLYMFVLSRGKVSTILPVHSYGKNWHKWLKLYSAIIQSLTKLIEYRKNIHFDQFQLFSSQYFHPPIQDPSKV